MFYYSPSHIFQKKKVSSFRKDLSFLFSILFHSRKAFLRTNTCFISFFRFVSLSLKKLFRIFKMKLSEFLCFSFTQVFLNLFSSLFFLFITFPFSPFFHFLLCLIFYFLVLLLLELCFFPFTFFIFWRTISLVYQKNTLQLITFHMHAFPLYVLLLIHLFICCLFFSLRFSRF